MLAHEVATSFDDVHDLLFARSSTEKLARLLCDMKRKDLIRLEGATLVIPNRIALQAIAS